MQEISNCIPYLLSEYKKASNLLSDLEVQYNGAYKSLRYQTLKTSYLGRVKKYTKLLIEVGRHGKLIKVKATGLIKSDNRKKNTYSKEQNVVMYFSNISLMDVEMILKRDYSELKDIHITEIILGKIYLELPSQF